MVHIITIQDVHTRHRAIQHFIEVSEFDSDYIIDLIDWLDMITNSVNSGEAIQKVYDRQRKFYISLKQENEEILQEQKRPCKNFTY